MSRSFHDTVSDGYELTVDEQFRGDTLDRTRWIPHYLPQWSGRERSRARYRVDDDCLELFIADDQEPWLPELEGDLRVSSIQSGCFAGPLGSRIGQHRTDDALVVVEEQPTERLITPQFAAVELRGRWEPHPEYMVAMFLVGFEDEPERSGEICGLEIFGSEAFGDHAMTGIGVKRWADPDVVDDFDKVAVPVDVRQWHDYGVIWAPTWVAFYVDGAEVKRVDQSPQYPMQLLINIYDFGGASPRTPAAPFQIDHVRIHEPALR